MEEKDVWACKGKMFQCLRVLKHNLLLVLTLVGVGLGFGVGFAINPLRPSEDVKLWLGLPGEMYLRMLKMTILPLIVANVIAGSASLDPRSNGRISVVALIYTLLTNTLGTLLGLAVYHMIDPGKYSSLNSTVPVESDTDTHLQTQDIIADLIRNLFPENIVAATFEKAQTTYTDKGTKNDTSVLQTRYVRETGTAPGTNLIGLIIMCTIVGMATPSAGQAGEIFVKFFQAASTIMIRVIRWLIWYTPVGVASLVAASVASVPNIGVTFLSLGMFFLAVALSTVFLNVIVVPLLYLVFIRRNPVRFLYFNIRPMATSFAPASTVITIPEILNTCGSKFHVDRRVSGFVIPLAAALNRPGSAAFIITAAIFLCDLEHESVGVGTTSMIVLLTVVGSLAIPAVPSGSIICILIILSSVNIHTSNIGLVLALEWITDRLRTTSNTISVMFCAILTYRFSRRSLRQSDVEGRIDNDVDVDVQLMQEI